jgi:ZIP family zinc transporter
VRGMENYLPFILSLIAGLSTIIGYFIIYLKKDKNKIIKYSLAFSSGVMLSVSLFDLIPESIFLTKKISLFVFVGLILAYLINQALPNEESLYKVGIFSMITIILHNIPEGIATFISAKSNISLGLFITLAITMHNIPEGISIAVPVYYSTKNKKEAFIKTFISGISEPFGAIIAYLFFPKINNNVLGNIFSLIAGLMIYISIFELLPNALKYNEKKKTLVFFIIGIIFMFVNHLLIKI